MKLKKVSAICKREKRYYLFDRTTESGGGEQWVGDGCAVYLLDGLPHLNEDNLCRMFDISEGQRDNIIIKQTKAPDSICWEDTNMDESEAKDMEPGLIYEGRELLPLMTREGIIFIDKKYLSPFNGEGEYIRLYRRRTSEGQAYIAVKAGLMIRGVIFPVDVVSDKLVNCLGDMLRECRRATEKAKGQSNEDGFELIWTEDESSEGGAK